MSTKEDIIDAATALFAERGYRGMTMKEIAKQVGIKAPSIYAFFKNKEDVFLHIYQGVLNEHLQLAAANASTTHYASVKSQLDAMFRSIMDYQLIESTKMKIFMRFLLFSPDGYGDELKDALVKIEKNEHQLLCITLQRGIDQGEIKAGDCSGYADLIMCMLDGLFWQMQRYEEAAFLKRFEDVWNQLWQLMAK